MPHPEWRVVPLPWRRQPLWPLVALLALALGGCLSPEERFTPAAAARARNQFLRAHGHTLSPTQIRWIGRIPYQRRDAMRSEMERIRDRGDEGLDGARAGRRSVRELLLEPGEEPQEP